MSANLDAVLFEVEGKPTGLLLGVCRARGALQGLQASAELLDPGGYGNDTFRRWWRAALPTRPPLPEEPIATREGRGTMAFWDALG